MKLRFDHQSIRLRVRKSDVDNLLRSGFIEESVYFPQGTLHYRLEMAPFSAQVSVAMSGDTILVTIPQDQALQWGHSAEVGIYATLTASMAGRELEVLIEKDFPCQHNSPEDNADTFEELSNT